MHRAACTILLLLGVFSPVTGSAAEVRFDPPSIRTDGIHCDDATFQVDLVVDGTVDWIQGFSIIVHFDPDVIQAVAARPGEILTDQPAPIFFWPFEDGFDAGVVQIDAAVLGATCTAPSADGSVVLAEIEFVKQECGGRVTCLTGLELELVDFRNNQNRSIEMGASDGTAQILPCILPAEPATWGEIKALYDE